jgi:hypothetical protein
MYRYPVALGLVLAFALISPMAAAQLSMTAPNAFAGNVFVNGKSAPNGLFVIAKIDGHDVAATETFNGDYGLPVDTNIFYVENPYGDREGKTIEFFVNNHKGGQSVFTVGEFTNLDLSIIGDVCGEGLCTSGESCSSCPSDCGACQTVQPPSGGGNSGGGSSSGGGGISSTPKQNLSQVNTITASCTPSITCTDWMDCINSKQNRVCTDANRCTNATMTTETKTCEQTIMLATSCVAGAKTCVGDDIMVCSSSGNSFNLVKTCARGCNSATLACNGEVIQGQFFDSGIMGMIIASPVSIYGSVIVLIALLGGVFFWKIRESKKITLLHNST